MALTGNQRRHLRALGHHLSPIVQVGHQGVTEGVVKALAQALLDHELVKVKLGQAVEDRHAAADALAAGSGAEVAQVLGKTVLLYLRRKKDPKIELPKPRSGPGAAPKPAPGRPAPRKAPKKRTDDEDSDAPPPVDDEE